MDRSQYIEEFWQAAGDLFSLPEVQRLREFTHHSKVTRYDHTVFVAFHSFCWARRLGLDARAAARGGMLHDLFHYTREQMGETGWRMIFRHPKDALELAETVTDLSEKEKNIIDSHMWPIARHAPHSWEALVVNTVDTVSAVYDYLGLSGKSERRLLLRLRRAARKAPLRHSGAAG